VSPSTCILLTREASDNTRLATLLRANGVVVREVPCTGTRWRQPTTMPDRVDLVAFSSRRSVIGFFKAGLMNSLCLPLGDTPFAVVGESTARTLRGFGVEPTIVADPQTGSALAEAIRDYDNRAKVLVVHGDLGKGELFGALTQFGQPVCDVTVYENFEPQISIKEQFPVAAVFVAAPSAARRLLFHMPWLRSSTFLPIGPTTESALRALGVGEFLEQTASLSEQVSSLTTAWHRAKNHTDNLE